MKRFFHNLFVAVGVFFSILLLQTGCKENTLISSKVSPAQNTLGLGTDTLWCITHTYLDDTILTSTDIGGIPIYEAIGIMKDPYFGITTGATYFQIVPFSTIGGINFNSTTYPNSTLYIDSVVLVLPYSGLTWGDTTDTNAALQYQVYYMADTMNISSNYYPYSTKPVSMLLGATTNVTLATIRDSFPYYNTNYHPNLRIKLDTSVVLPLIAKADDTGITQFLNPGGVGSFNGICVKAAGTPMPFMPYYILSDGSDFYSQAGLLVYFHDNKFPYYTVIGNDSDQIAQYGFNSTYCAHNNSIARNYTGYPVNSLLYSKMKNDNVIALQNQPGASLDISVYGIKSIPKNIIINKAELQLSLLPEYNDSLKLWGPYTFYPLGIDSAGLAYTIADRYPLTSTSPLAIIGGYAHTFTNNGTNIKTYTIDMPREIESAIVANKDTLHLHINGSQDFYGAFHAVLGGGNYNDTRYRAKLVVVYSKL